MKRLYLVIPSIIFATVLIVPAFARPPMILMQKSTWDADMINSDSSGYTGKGVYVAVLDTGLTSNWRDYFPAERIATELGMGFYEPVHYNPKTDSEVGDGYVVETSWVGSTYSTHGTHVVSTIIGYNYYSTSDAAAGLSLPPLYIKGIAPDVTIIPVKVLHNYNLGSEGKFVFGTDNAVAAGIDYVRGLKEMHPEWPIVISMSIGAGEPSPVEKAAIDAAIDAGVIIVAAAGNAGSTGMDWPGAYPEVISAGANGWRYEWLTPTTKVPYYRLWWLQDNTYGYNDIVEPTAATEVYVTDFSSRENQTLAGLYPWAGPQQLDVIAPGSWVRGPFPGTPGYSHLPWWAAGNPPPTSPVFRGNNFYYVGGTSMATPHVSSVAAHVLEKDPTLTQAQVEFYIKSTALPIPAGSMTIFDISPTQGWYTYSWGGTEATGSGLILADAATAATP